jgi:nitrate reductase NapAB chaperone NapD
MPICSYLVIAGRGESGAAASRLAAIPGCEVSRAAERDVLILVTDTEGRAAEEALRERIAAVPEIHSLLLAFGEIEPTAAPAGAGRRHPRPALP